MDLSFRTDCGKFNYRACAVILRDGEILAMHDERSPYYYLPGGRVQFGETAEAAVLREVREELRVTGRIVRPLWLNQAFFTEDVDHLPYHELCIYFLVDVDGTGLTAQTAPFSIREGAQTLTFEWLPFARLRDAYFYPEFLKSEIFHLPDALTLRTETE